MGALVGVTSAGVGAVVGKISAGVGEVVGVPPAGVGAVAGVDVGDVVEGTPPAIGASVGCAELMLGYIVVVGCTVTVG